MEIKNLGIAHHYQLQVLIIVMTKQFTVSTFLANGEVNDSVPAFNRM